MQPMEYQYYEFQALDQPLDDNACAALRRISSRAKITSTGFIKRIQLRRL